MAKSVVVGLVKKLETKIPTFHPLEEFIMLFGLNVQPSSLCLRGSLVQLSKKQQNSDLREAAAYTVLTVIFKFLCPNVKQNKFFSYS